MFKLYCVNCGSQFESESKMSRYCPSCQEKKKAEQKEKQKGYAKARAAKLGLTQVSIFQADKDKLKEMAKKQEKTLAEVLQELLKDK